MFKLFNRSANNLKSCVQLKHLKRTLTMNEVKSYPIEIHSEVQKALRNGNPVVALESTIITHGT